MSFQVGIGSLGGTVYFQVGLYTPLRIVKMMVKVVKLLAPVYEKAALINFIRKHPCRSLSLNKVSFLHAKDSCTGVFLYVLPNISERFLCKIPLGNCFC